MSSTSVCCGKWLSICCCSAAAPSVSATRCGMRGPSRWAARCASQRRATALPARVARTSLPLGPWPGGRLRAPGLPQQGRHDLLGGARVGGDGVEAGDDGLLLLAALLPLAQAHGRPRGGRLHHRHPFAIGLHDQDRRRRGRRPQGQPAAHRSGPHPLAACGHAGLEGLHAERQPQDAFQHRLALAVGLVRRAIDHPLPQQVRVAARRQAQLRIERADAPAAPGR